MPAFGSQLVRNKRPWPIADDMFIHPPAERRATVQRNALFRQYVDVQCKENDKKRCITLDVEKSPFVGFTLDSLCVSEPAYLGLHR